MSDEELVQCPNNPNHQVPRSQINEHVNTCKLLMDPNQEMQIRTSSDDEPRPSTSYQELPQEGSSNQGGSLLQEGSSQQEESQIAELPNLQGPCFHEWRPPKDPTKLQEKSSSGLKMQRLISRSLRKSGILAESEIESCKQKLEQDKKSSFRKPEMRIELYYKILHEKMKLLEKLKIDSSSDEDFSSSSGSTLSLIDIMPDKKKKTLYNMGTEFLEQLRSTSQQTGSSQQESSSPKPKMTGEEIHKQTDVERWVIESSRFMSEVTTPLEVKLEEPPSTEDVLQKQSQSFSESTETTHDSDLSQKSKVTEEKISEKMDAEEKNKAQVSPTLLERITQIEIKLENFSLAADVSKKQSQSVSSPTETKKDSDRSQKPKMTEEQIPEKMGTEEENKAQVSPTLSERITQIEIKLEKLSLAADDSKRQIQSVSSPTETKKDSDRSQKPKMTEDKTPKKMDTEEEKKTKASPTFSKMITQLEIELGEFSLTADVPQQQLQPVSSPTETKRDSDRLQQQKIISEKKHEEMETEAEMKTEESHTLSEVITQLEVELVEPSLAADVPQQQIQPVSSPTETKRDSDRLQQQKIISEKKHEEMETEAEMETEESHTLSEVTTQLEVELEEPSLVADAPLQQSQPFSFDAATTHVSDDSQQPKIISKKKHEEMNTEEKIQTEESHTLSEVTTQLEVESEESSLFEVVPQQQSQPFSFPAATTHDSDVSQQPEIMSKKQHEEMDNEKKRETEESHTLSQVINQVEVESQKEETMDAAVSHIFAEETNSRLVETEEPSLSRNASEIIVAQPDETFYDEVLQVVILQEESSLQQEDSSQPEERRREKTSYIWKFLHSVEIDSPEPIVTLYEEDEDLQPLTLRELSTPETDNSQGRDRLTIRSYRSSRESTDIDNLQKERKSPEADISSESDGSQRKKEFLEITRRYDSSSSTDEDVGVKIDLEKPFSSSPKKRSKQVGSRGKTKHQLVVPQEASGPKKRAHETSSESTDIDKGDLQKAVRSPKSDIPPKADGSQRKKKFLGITRRYDSSSTTDEDNDEKIDLEKPSTSSSTKQSKPVVSPGKTKHQLDVPQEASRLRKRSHETSSESTDIDVSDFQKSSSSRKSAISPEADSSQRKKKFLEIRRRFEASSTKDTDTDEQIDLEKPSTSSPTKQSKPVVSPGKTKHQLDVPQEASRLRKRSYETSSESTDIDISDLQKSSSSRKSAISPEADSSQRKKKFLEIRRRFEASSTKDTDTDEEIDLEKPSTSSSTKQSKPVVSPGKTKHQLDVPQEASRLRKRSYETSSEGTDIDIDDIPIAVSSPKSDISPKGDGSQRKKKFLEIGKRYDSSSKKDEDKDEKKGI